MPFASKDAVFNDERGALKALLRAATFHVVGHSDRRSSFVGLLQGDHNGVSAKINPEAWCLAKCRDHSIEECIVADKR